MSFQYAIRKNAPVDEQRDRELEDYLARLMSAVEWTPVVTQGVAVSITNVQSFYSVMGDWVIGMFGVGVTSSGTAGQQVRISLPVTAAIAQNNIGMASIYDNSTFIRYPGVMDMTALAQVFLSDTTQASGAWALGTVTFTAALASGDSITGSFRYKWT